MTSTASVPTLTLNDGHSIPAVGLGVGELSDGDTERAVASALGAGYRLIDTAAVYGNEAAVGRAIAASGVPRAEIVVTTKVATDDQGYQSVQEALRVSLDKLGLDYVDLYLIHWPAAQQGRYVDTYGGMLRSQADGFIRSIGVCNFSAEHVSTVTDLTFVAPAVNQIELHPLLNQAELRRTNAEAGVRTQAYGPLGSPAGVGALTAQPVVTAAADAHGKSPAQVLIRWSVQLGNVVIPRSSDPQRIAANIDVFDFELTDEEMAAVSDLDDGTRYRPDPSDYTGS